MTAIVGRTAWDRLARIRRQRRFQTALTLGLVVLGPSLAAATFFVMSVMGEGADSRLLRGVLLADLVYVLILAGLVLQRIMRMVADRRARSAGSELHFRLIRVFAFVALTPTVLVAVFATLTLNFGLEGWFSDRVRHVVTNSMEAAQAYQAEHREEVARDAATVARFLAEARAEAGFLTDSDLRQLLNLDGLSGQHNLARAFIVDGTGALRVRGERSYLFDFEPPTADELTRARAG
ncbi:MAG: PAS domain-containing sensor histidine kinase, partial [Rhodobacteraceae bacterium]|nr:PAS domain-containing sensor histidine kinase [Paracoccaceae bacterium]